MTGASKEEGVHADAMMNGVPSWSTLIPLLLAISGLAVALLYLRWQAPTGAASTGFDEGMFAYCAAALAETSRLYEFCTDNKPPGIFLVYSTIFASSAWTWSSLWWLCAVTQVVTWCSFVLLLRKRVRIASIALTLALSVGTTFLVLDGVATVELFSMPLQLLCLMLVFAGWTESAGQQMQAYLFAVAGAAVGGLLMLRPNNTASSILVIAGVLAAPSWRACFQRACFAASGFCLALALIFAGAGGTDAVYGTLRYAFAQGAGYSDAQSYGRSAAFASNLLWAGSLFVPGFAAIWLFTGRRNEDENPDRRDVSELNPDTRLMAIVAGWFFVELLFSSISSRRYPHYAQMLVVPLGTLFALACERLHRNWSNSRGTGCPRSQTNWTTRAYPFILVTAVVFAISPTVREGLRTPLGRDSFAEYRATLAETARSLGASSFGLLVWGGSPETYLSLGISSPTRHVNASTLTTKGFTTSELLTEFVECIDGSRPRVVLDVMHGTTLGISTGAVSAYPLVPTAEWPQARQYLRTTYKFLRVIDGTSTAVWLRRPEFDNTSLLAAAKDCRVHRGKWNLWATR